LNSVFSTSRSHLAVEEGARHAVVVGVHVRDRHVQRHALRQRGDGRAQLLGGVLALRNLAIAVHVVVARVDHQRPGTAGDQVEVVAQRTGSADRRMDVTDVELIDPVADLQDVVGAIAEGVADLGQPGGVEGLDPLR
jgi:hypothetical protein